MKLFGLLSVAVLLAQSTFALKYMPLGDSITGMDGVCWRPVLYQRLKSVGFDMSQVDFVGSLKGTCRGSVDEDHEGHPGFKATDIADQKLLVDWLKRQGTVDIITMHLGTNDLAGNVPPTDILKAYTTLVSQMRANNPKVKIIVAKIIPILATTPSYWVGRDAKAKELNAKIPDWAAGLSTKDSPITVVDQYTGITNSDLSDGVHPNASGDKKMSDKWFPAVVSALVKSGVYPVRKPTA